MVLSKAKEGRNTPGSEQLEKITGEEKGYSLLQGSQAENSHRPPHYKRRVGNEAKKEN